MFRVKLSSQKSPLFHRSQFMEEPVLVARKVFLGPMFQKRSQYPSLQCCLPLIFVSFVFFNAGLNFEIHDLEKLSYVMFSEL